MYESSLDYVCCVRCKGKLELDVLYTGIEIDEGFLICDACNLHFPIIDGVAVFWDTFESFISKRASLGGRLYLQSRHKKLKSFIKKSMTKTKARDISKTESRWCKIYQASSNANFYRVIKRHLNDLPHANLTLEYGCSIGGITSYAARSSDVTFGIDKSFDAIKIAKTKKNCDFFVSDFMSHPFDISFDRVIGLNILDIVETFVLLDVMSRQIKKGYLILSDPFDFDRGENSKTHIVDEVLLRESLRSSDFTILPKTKEPSYISWNLKINSRSTLNYLVDVVICKK